MSANTRSRSISLRVWPIDFLAVIAAEFVPIPGNHDVCWNTAYSAMKRVVLAQEPKNIVLELQRRDTRFRWSWTDRCFFEVADFARYRSRLDSFWLMTERFYQGVHLPIPLDRSRGFNLFEIDSGRIVVAAFSSLGGNDCFALHGSLEQGAVANCALALRDAGRAYRLRVATWHHSIQGPPDRTDYMDAASVQNMIGYGFRLGLHGHQHVAETSARYIHVPEEEAMALISAGSLCAGVPDLPRGVNRQYNVIVIDDDYRGCRVHVRQMGDGEHFGPKQDGAFAGRGYVRLSWEPALDLAGRPVDGELRATRARVLAAEKEVREGSPSRALSLLRGVPTPPDLLERALVLEAGEREADWALVLATIGEPTSADELVRSVSALEHLHRFEDATQLLSSEEGGCWPLAPGCPRPPGAAFGPCQNEFRSHDHRADTFSS